MLKCQKEFSLYIDTLDEQLASSFFSEKYTYTSMKSQISDAELIVPVIGAFSAGKSTLINNLLGTSVLPVGIAPETELATELRYADEAYILAIKENGAEERFTVDQLTEINRRSSEYLFLRLYLNNPALQAISPLVLVDMPGFGSSLENHNKAIAFYMPRGVHFVVVISIEDGSLTQSMLRQLKEISGYETGFTFLLSKTNLRSPEQVTEVKQYIEDQLALYFAGSHQVIPIDSNEARPLSKALGDLHPEAMFAALFLDLLKEQNLDVIEQINLALHSLRQNSRQRKEALEALNNALHMLQTQRDATISDIRNKFNHNAQDRCLKSIDQALHGALDEFVTLALRKDERSLSNALSDVVRGNLTETIRIELDSVSKNFVDKIAKQISFVQGDLVFSEGKNWGLELGDKVYASLQNATKSLEGWKAVLDKTSSDQGRVLYKTISTVIAVTTTIINPVMELILIFLPEIIRFFTAGNERETIRTKLLTESFPGIKAELRRHLPQILDEELQRLLNTINQEFEAQIAKQQQIISAFHDDHAVNDEELARQQTSLEELRAGVQSLAKQYLYA